MSAFSSQIERLSNFISDRFRASQFYDLKSTWRIPGRIEDVVQLFLNSDELANWWGGSFLEADVLANGDHLGCGRRVRVVTKGFLPYTLEFEFKVTEVSYPGFFKVVAEGDFVGSGSGRLVQVDDEVQIVFDWNIQVNKPLLKNLSFIARPFFIANHRSVMRNGQRKIKKIMTERFMNTTQTTSSPTEGLGSVSP